MSRAAGWLETMYALRLPGGRDLGEDQVVQWREVVERRNPLEVVPHPGRASGRAVVGGARS